MRNGCWIGFNQNAYETTYRLFIRGNGVFYSLDTIANKQKSLNTRDADEAERLLIALNEAEKQPAINLQIAKAYLAAADSSFVNRTWREVMSEFLKTKHGSNYTRSERAIMDKPSTAWFTRRVVGTLDVASGWPRRGFNCTARKALQSARSGSARLP